MWGWPALGRATAPLFARLVDHPLGLDAARLGLAFLLMVVPAAAMGATLPLLVAALARGEASFGQALGRLYGWNTLGAVAGALLGEGWLVGALGVRGTGCAAAALNLCAAAAAVGLAARGLDRTPAAPAGERQATGEIGLRRLNLALLVASALAGGNVLALEVLWFCALMWSWTAPARSSR